jgi:short subunit dehydrogenase-like uncharacterized protein
MASTNFDIILFGATSFVGKITTRYLFSEIGLNGDIKWAIAGRCEKKLNRLKQSLGSDAVDLTVIIADSCNPQSLNRLCQHSRVILSTVGPYALYGEPLIKACVENGTDYCDLTGEAYWIKLMLDKYQNKAQRSGARIINCCGFDSIPSDLGVHFLQQVAKRQYGHCLNEVKLRVKSMKGGVSGGTIASAIAMFIAAEQNPDLRRTMSNPYLLCPEGSRHTIRQPRIKGPVYDVDFNSWSAPFVMEAINTRIVLRSHGLQSVNSIDELTYGEAVLTGKGKKGYLRACGVTLGLACFAIGLKIKPLRYLMQKFMLPKPGSGPSEQQQLEGFFDIRLIGKKDGRHSCIKVLGDRDPGYGCTAKMLVQAGLCMAFDITKNDLQGGFWTPATAMGDKLIKRLIQSAGMSFETVN